MKSSTSLALAAAAVLGLSLGLKVWVGPTTAAAATPVSRTEALHRFLVAQVGPVQSAQGGWRFASKGCEVVAMPSGPRGTLDLEETKHAKRSDRIAYVYRGRVSDERPSLSLGMDVVAYMLAKPFRPAAEPGYVVLIARRGCPALPVLPWNRLPT